MLVTEAVLEAASPAGRGLAVESPAAGRAVGQLLLLDGAGA